MSNVGQMPSQPVVPPANATKSPPPPSVITTTSTTTPPLVTANNNHSSTPPPTSLAKNNSLTGPLTKKDKRQISSKFNTSPQQGVEIETLPPLKGRWKLFFCIYLKLAHIWSYFWVNFEQSSIFLFLFTKQFILVCEWEGNVFVFRHHRIKTNKNYCLDTKRGQIGRY